MLGSTVVIASAVEKTKPLTDFANVLDVTVDFKEVIYGTYSTNEYNNFSDLGAWHGYYLHDKSATDLYGGFAGSVIVAEELGYTNDVEKYTKEAKYLRDYINENMYDEETGFYYDVQTNEDGSVKKLLVNRGKGTEGWIPLWAKAATSKQ